MSESTMQRRKQDPFDVAVAEFEAARRKYSDWTDLVNDLIRIHEHFLHYFKVANRWSSALDKKLVEIDAELSELKQRGIERAPRSHLPHL